MNDAKQFPAPRDRLIKLVANIVDHDGPFTSVETWEGLARWDDQSNDWLDASGMSIRMCYESELIPLEWEESEPNFVLCGEGRLTSATRAETAPLALPEPAWHTGDTVTLARFISRLSDEELIELERDHNQAMKSFFGREYGGLKSFGASGRCLAYEEWMKRCDTLKGIENTISLIMVLRFKEAVKKRKESAEKAAETRRRNSRKARMAA